MGDVLNISAEIIGEFKRWSNKIYDAQVRGYKAKTAIASSLWHLNSSKFSDYLESLGCKNIGEYAHINYGIEKTTTYDSIAIMDIFGNEIKDRISEEFSNYSFTQLRYMLQAAKFITDENGNIDKAAILSEFPADMSSREMAAKIKKEKKSRKMIEGESTEKKGKNKNSTRAENEEKPDDSIENETVKDTTLENAIRLLTNFYNEHGYLFEKETNGLLFTISPSTTEMMLTVI